MVRGTEIVLTSDRSLLTTYGNNLYMGLAASLPTNVCPDSLYHSLLCPPVPANSDGTVALATPALTTTEAILVRNMGLERDKVKIAHPDHIERLVGENTKIVGISVMDPLGLGPSTTTWSTLFSGIPHTRVEFLRLMLGKIKPLKEKYGFKVVVGGPGSWQINHAQVTHKLGVDYIIIGEGEKVIPPLFESLLSGNEPEEKVIEAPIADPEEVPPVLTPSVFGMVEISRGCGRGCKFCVPATSGKMRMLPLEEKIIPDIKVHVEAGIKAITFHSDDALRYGSKNFLIDEDALMNLYKAAFEAGAKEVYITHATLAPFAYQPDVIERLTKFLRRKGHKYYGCQPGIETGSSRLIRMHMLGKPLPYKPEEWSEMIKEAYKVMTKNKWVSVGTLMQGLPGEEREDILETIELIKSLDKYPSLFVPLFFVPMKFTTLEGMRAFIANYMRKEHWQLLLACWKHNVKYIEPLYNMTTELHTFGSRVGITVLTRLLGFFIEQKEKQLEGKSRLLNAISNMFRNHFDKTPIPEQKIIKKVYT
ncbi:MAG: B12-binding domain-containing radical SAM protein [Candidatus Odinarchaeia archaeon]